MWQFSAQDGYSQCSTCKLMFNGIFTAFFVFLCARLNIVHIEIKLQSDLDVLTFIIWY